MNTANLIPEVRTTVLNGAPTEVMNAAAVKHLAWTTTTPQAKKLRKLIAKNEMELRSSNPLLSEDGVVKQAVLASLKTLGGEG